MERAQSSKRRRVVVAGDARENGDPLQIVRIPDLEGWPYWGVFLLPRSHKSAAFGAKFTY